MPTKTHLGIDSLKSPHNPPQPWRTAGGCAILTASVYVYATMIKQTTTVYTAILKTASVFTKYSASLNEIANIYNFT